MRAARLAAGVLALAATLAACGGSTGSGSSSASGSASGSSDTGTLTVLAASSLTESFDQLAKTFEQQHPGVHVRLTYDSSATLAQQVVQGAPADVLATADGRTMQIAVKGKGIQGTPKLFATNRLVLAVPADNPAHITGLSDVTRPGVKFVMCDVSVPCGALGQTVLGINHVHATPASLEPDVKSVLTKVELDEADAGLVYTSDAAAGGAKVRSFQIPSTAKTINDYFIAPVAQSQQAALAAAWVRLVTSPQGEQVLQAHGFGRP